MLMRPQFMSHISYEECQSSVSFIHYKRTVDCPRERQVSWRHIYKTLLQCLYETESLSRWWVETRSPNRKGGDREGRVVLKREGRGHWSNLVGTCAFPKLILVTQGCQPCYWWILAAHVEDLKLHVLGSSSQLLKDNHASFQTEMKEDQCPLSLQHLYLWAHLH